MVRLTERLGPAIFSVVYAVLHHPEYRERYAANLKRELPRIPFVSRSAKTSVASHPERSASSARSEGPMHLSAEYIDPSARKERGPQDDKAVGGRRGKDDRDVFRAFVAAGQRLAELHVNYESQPDATSIPSSRPEPRSGGVEGPAFPRWLENPQARLDYRVGKMRLSKDKTSLFYNEYWTLTNIPAEVYEYRLGNRSALEWIVDQYQVSTDKRSGIVNDPNREGDPEYIKRLIGQVVYVSLETVKIVNALPEFAVETAQAAAATS
jgi:predicted helicase